MLRAGLSGFITAKPLNSTSELSTSFLNKLKGLDTLESALNSAVYSQRVHGIFILCFLFLIS